MAAYPASFGCRFPAFPAALSFLMMLGPSEARGLLEQQRQKLARRLADLDADIAARGQRSSPLCQ